MPSVIDATERLTALNPEQSFIVQAPAGSGKTELLTQRFLRLLATVDYPEEIYAITFTRKAAGEMRRRIIEALESALSEQPNEAHKLQTWQLASQVLQRDNELAWSLLKNPNRLRVLTFDSLCQSLTRQMPMIAELGAPPSVKEDASTLYQQAALATLQALEEDGVDGDLAHLLQHLGNNLNRLASLISSMLARRDQWLRYVIDTPDVDSLNEALALLIAEHLEALSAAIPTDLFSEIFRLQVYAADNLDASHPLCLAFSDQRHEIPSADINGLHQWQTLANWLLTNTGTVRKSITKNQGFPAPSSFKDKEQKANATAAKKDMQQLCQALGESPECIALLADSCLLPLRGLNQQQSQLLESLMAVLLRAAGELQLVFQEQGEFDFAEVQLRAIMALGSPEEPTDLALSLDYRIRHLLVDEFQDTSHSQYHLLETLSAGWQVDDGRTLFLVGDPMQSIYRFREAEVGLYLQTREQGLGDLPLTPLQLSVNFRSSTGIVDWVNQSFDPLFPEHTDVASGAVSYSSSTPFNSDNAFKAVNVHGLLDSNDYNRDEAQQIGAIIQDTLTNTEGDIAVLARGRNHLHAIAQELKEQHIRFQAIEVDALADSALIQDLYSLTRALTHTGDRLAWLSILRAPWCGLSLEDLMMLAGDGQQNILQRLSKEALITSLSEDGQIRAQRLYAVVKTVTPLRAKQSLRQIVESIWLQLGGLAIANDNAEAEASAYFQLLDKQADTDNIVDFAQFEQALNKLFAPVDSQADGRVQLMTMHKSKGLEFDTVILPSLHKKSRSNQSELLSWQERPAQDGQRHLLMAPIKSAEEEKEPISTYLQKLENDKDSLEVIRLLYVAATRAKQKLHLFGALTSDEKNGEIKTPAKGCLLGRLWPVVEQSITTRSLKSEECTPLENQQQRQQRLPENWQPKAIKMATANTITADIKEAASIDFQWASDTARHVGTLVHRYLETIAKQGIEHWPISRLETHTSSIKAALAALGVSPDELNNAINKTLKALKQSLEDETGRWILSNHNEAQCEYALTVNDEKAKHFIIDRTFIDDDGTRWIIDYKTGDHIDDDIEDFLDNEQTRYREQLENYGRLLGLMEKRKTKLALYFPLLKNWRVWDYGSAKK